MNDATSMRARIVAEQAAATATERLLTLRAALTHCDEGDRASLEATARRISLLTGQILGLCYHHTDADDPSAPPIDEL